MSLLRRRDPTKGKTAELAELRRRRDRLSRRFASLRIADQVAAIHMREVLGQDAATDAAVDAATAARGRSAMAVESMIEAIADADAEIAEAEQQLAAEQDRAQRQQVAAELERQAQAVEAAVEALVASMTAVGKASEQLFTAARTAGNSGDHGLPSSSVAQASAIILAAVREVAPEIARWRGAWEVGLGSAQVGAGDLARGSFVSPLRQLAADILSGVSAAVIPGAPAPALARIAFADTVIVLGESIQWHGIDGQPVQVSEGGVTIPSPVAAAALALGIGHAPGSREAELIMSSIAGGEPQMHGLRRGPATPPEIVRRGPPHRDVGVNLYQLAEQESRRVAERAAA